MGDPWFRWKLHGQPHGPDRAHRTPSPGMPDTAHMVATLASLGLRCVTPVQGQFKACAQHGAYSSQSEMHAAHSYQE